MKCDDLLMALNAHVDGIPLESLCEEFASHLEGCNPCQVVVDNLRHTIQLFQNGKPYPMPESFQHRLHDALKARWDEKFSQSY